MCCSVRLGLGLSRRPPRHVLLVRLSSARAWSWPRATGRYVWSTHRPRPVGPPCVPLGRLGKCLVTFQAESSCRPVCVLFMACVREFWLRGPILRKSPHWRPCTQKETNGHHHYENHKMLCRRHQMLLFLISSIRKRRRASLRFQCV